MGREAPRGEGWAFVALCLRPLRVTKEQRELERPSDGQREAASTGLGGWRSARYFSRLAARPTLASD